MGAWTCTSLKASCDTGRCFLLTVAGFEMGRAQHEWMVQLQSITKALAALHSPNADEEAVLESVEMFLSGPARYSYATLCNYLILFAQCYTGMRKGLAYDSILFSYHLLTPIPVRQILSPLMPRSALARRQKAPVEPVRPEDILGLEIE